MTTICEECKKEVCPQNGICPLNPTNRCHGHEVWEEKFDKTFRVADGVRNYRGEIAPHLYNKFGEPIYGVTPDELKSFTRQTIASEKQRLGEKLAGAVPEMPFVENSRYCSTHKDFKCGECTEWNTARAALITALRSEGVEITE